MLKKKYEEQQRHNTLELPIALHQLTYPEGTDVLFYLHWHKEFEFIVVTEGSIEMHIEDSVFTLRTGDCAFINSNLYHSGRTIDCKTCSFFAVDFSYQFLNEDRYSHFSREYIQPILDGTLLFPSHIACQNEPEYSWQRQLVSLLWDINSCGQEGLGSYELLAKSRIYTVWELCFEHAEVNLERDDYQNEQLLRLKPVIEYINENFNNEITLKELADILPMSEGQFCRVFKACMKVTPFRYIIRCRILKSCSYLMESDKKIWEIANLCGFNNISYYNKVFAKFIGCTPKQYRRSM